MQIDPASIIDAPLGVVRLLLREAGLRILAAHGHDLDPGPMMAATYARFAGYEIRYYRAEANSLSHRGPGNWNTPTFGPDDEPQHVLDIEIGEQVVGLGWRNTGPVLHDRLQRGPWELELLSLAGMKDCLQSAISLPSAAPQTRSKRTWSIHDIERCRRRRLSAPVTFDVLGYNRCIPAIAPPGSTFHDLVRMVSDCYDLSREQDGVPDPNLGFASYAMRGWKGERPLTKRGLSGRPDFQYWIAPHGGAKSAARLLLLLDQPDQQ